MKHPSAYVHGFIRRFCTRLSSAILARSQNVDGPARAAMEEIAEAVKEAGAR